MPLPSPRTARRANAMPSENRGTNENTGELDSLRERLVDSRARRGACPRFSDLKKDHLPQLSAFEGREVRTHHLELCLICQSNLRNWKNSWSGKSEIAMAWGGIGAHRTRITGGRGIQATTHFVGKTVSSIAQGAWGVWQRHRQTQREQRAARALVAAEFALATAAAPSAEIQAPAPAPAPDLKPSLPAPPSVPAVSPSRPVAQESEAIAPLPPPAKKRFRAPSFRRNKRIKLPPLVVIETGPGLPDMSELAVHVEARGGALVAVDSVDEIFKDRDFSAVRTIFLARPRPLGEWPSTYERIRKNAPQRRVYAVVAVPPTGAIAKSLLRDENVLNPPIQESDWILALERAGWSLPK